MTKINSPSLRLFALLLISGQLAFAGPWPKLDTDQQKLQYGLALRAQVKPFFTGTFNYGMEWWNIATDQQKAQSALAGLYPGQLDSRPLSVLTLKQVVEKEVPNAAQISELRKMLANFIAQNQAIETKESVIAEILLKASALQNAKAGELVSHLLNSFEYSRETREKVNKASFAEKIEFLKNNLPSDLSQTTIAKVSKQRFTPENLGSKTQVLALIDQLLTAESDLFPLLGVLVASDALPKSATKSQLDQAIRNFDLNAVMTSGDADFISKILRNNLQGTHTASDQKLEETVKLTANTFLKSVNKLTAEGAEKIRVQTPYVQLVEKPRDIAILRSAVANDCTHTCSFARADDPEARIFFFVDAVNNKELGYVETEIKSSDRGDVLYLSSINGPTITPEQTEQILHLLYNHRAELGVKEIVIAARNLDLHMNYFEVIQHLQKLVDGRPRLAVQAKNQQIATIVDQFIKENYQKEFDNREAVIYQPAAALQNLSSLYAQKADDVTFRHDLNKKDVTLFALELDATERWLPQQGSLSDGERAIKAANLNIESYQKLRATLQNREHQPYQTYLETAKKALHENGIELDKTLLSERPHLFYDGQLAASDALTGAMQKSTLKLATQIIKRGMWHATWGLKELGKNPQNLQIINGSKEMEDVFKWMQSDLAFHSIQLKNMASAGLGFNKIKESEMTKKLLRLLSERHPWAANLANEVLSAAYSDAGSQLVTYLKDLDPNVRMGAMKMLEKKSEPKMSYQSISPKKSNSFLQTASESSKAVQCLRLF